MPRCQAVANLRCPSSGACPAFLSCSSLMLTAFSRNEANSDRAFILLSSGANPLVSGRFDGE